jgi:hypothetical protein
MYNTIEDYREALEARITEKTHEFEGEFDVAPVGFRESAFTEVGIESLLDLGQVPDIQPCYFDRSVGRYAVKVNGWAVDELSGEIDLVTTIYNGRRGSDSVPPSEVRKAVGRAARVVAEAYRGIHEQMEPASPAWDMMQSLHAVAGSVSRVRVVVLTDANTKDFGPLEEEFEFEVQADVWDLTRLFRAESSGLPYEPVEIDLIGRTGSALPCIAAPSLSDEYDAYVALIPGELLHDLYHEFGPRLLELNVRSFLQARGKVNRGIRDTLKDEPGRFLAYNNGISITAEDIELNEDSNGRVGIARIVGMQVVNGGQTVASIHRARDRDGFDISKVSVQAKITVVHGGTDIVEELVPLISRYANTQNRVNEADFSANHPFHVKVQQLANTTWAPGEQHRWFYERARGQYDVARAREGTTPARKKRFDETNPRAQKFDKVLLAKCFNSWEQLPHIVSQGGQKNFVEFMKRLAKSHRADWEPDIEYYRRLVAKAIIHKQAERSARKHKFSGYRANAVAYTIAAISYRTAGRIDLNRIWEEQACSPALNRTIHEWMPVIHQQLMSSAGQRNVTEWCKKEDCWRHIQAHGIPVPADLENELAEGQPLPTVGNKAQRRGSELSPQDRENIARTMQCRADQWLHLVKWGADTGELEGWQIGIAGTLATYAVNGWIEVPSAKQAAQAVRILEIADHNQAWFEED